MFFALQKKIIKLIITVLLITLVYMFFLTAFFFIKKTYKH